MNVTIGTEAAEFLFWEHINGIFVVLLKWVKGVTISCNSPIIKKVVIRAYI
jgi:hypothetical protein